MQDQEGAVGAMMRGFLNWLKRIARNERNAGSRQGCIDVDIDLRELRRVPLQASLLPFPLVPFASSFTWAEWIV